MKRKQRRRIKTNIQKIRESMDDLEHYIENDLLYASSSELTNALHTIVRLSEYVNSLKPNRSD